MSFREAQANGSRNLIIVVDDSTQSITTLYLNITKRYQNNVKEVILKPQISWRLTNFKSERKAILGSLGDFGLDICKVRSQKAFFLSINVSNALSANYILKRFKSYLPSRKKGVGYIDTEKCRVKDTEAFAVDIIDNNSSTEVESYEARTENKKNKIDARNVPYYKTHQILNEIFSKRELYSYGKFVEQVQIAHENKFIQYTAEHFQVEINKGIRTQGNEFLKHYIPVVALKYLSYNQVVERYGICLKTVDNYRKSKILKVYGMEGSSRVFFLRSEIEASLKLING